MPVFRHQPRRTTAAHLWREATAAVARGSALDVLLATAAFACALADADLPATVTAAATAAQWSLAAARHYLGCGPKPCLPPGIPCPATAALELSPWEGVRYYALWPEGYARAARAWQATRPPAPVWVLGLRSAGSLLAPVVAAALEAKAPDVLWSTLRPSGHPFDRQIAFDPAQAQAARRWPGVFLIVDEGPGLSGSSFAGTVRALRAAGVAAHRITLMPAWSPSAVEAARLNNPYAATHWTEWQVFTAQPLPAPAGAERDLTGGQWRGVLHPDANAGAPVWPAHERLKFLADSGRTVVKFAGWGVAGRATRERARNLARAGWGPPLAASDGDEPREPPHDPWLRYQRLAFQPLGRPTPDWCAFAGRYLAWVAAEYGLQPAAAPTAAVQALNPDPPPDGPLIALDGRMLACEWGLTRNGWVKFDATDHGDDPFFPGPADIAWDLASIGVEFGPAAEAAVTAAYLRRSSDRSATLARRLAWHRTAYRNFRHAYRTMAEAAQGNARLDGLI